MKRSEAIEAARLTLLRHDFESLLSSQAEEHRPPVVDLQRLRDQLALVQHQLVESEQKVKSRAERERGLTLRVDESVDRARVLQEQCVIMQRELDQERCANETTVRAGAELKKELAETLLALSASDHEREALRTENQSLVERERQSQLAELVEGGGLSGEDAAVLAGVRKERDVALKEAQRCHAENASLQERLATAVEAPQQASKPEDGLSGEAIRDLSRKKATCPAWDMCV